MSKLQDVYEAIDRIDYARRAMVEESDEKSQPDLPVTIMVEEAVKGLRTLALKPAEAWEDAGPDLYVAMAAVDPFLRAWDAWVSHHQATGEDADGTRTMWGLAVALAGAKVGARKPVKVNPHKESANGVGNVQLAKMLEWRNPDRTPQMQKIAEELATPGTHWSEDYILPSYNRYVAELEAKWRQRYTDLPYGPTDEDEEESEFGGRDAPESLDELIIQGLEARQILKMKPVAVEEIEDRAMKLGIVLPDRANLASYRKPRLAESVAQSEAERQESIELESKADEILNQGPAESIEEKIYRLADNDLKAGDIRKVLENEHPDLTTRRVGTILKERKQPAGT